MLRLLTAAALLCANLVHCAPRGRAEQLQRMKQYETTYLEPVAVDENTMTLEFDAFGQHYEVEFRRQIDAAPSTVIHSNVAEEVHGAVSSVSTSCQWQGTVLNFERVSVVSASFCEGQGIRARVAAFDEILIIKPAAYYLDLAKDAMGTHSLADEVLMYRVSDFDRPQIMGTEGVLDFDDAMTNEEGEAMRRRLYSSASPGNTEMTVLIGPVRIANYRANYANWYSQLFYDTQGMINSVDAIYAATNWNADGRNSVGYAGSLRVRFNEIHLIFSFSGKYASLAPEKRFSDCPLDDDEYDDSDECAIKGNDWLGQISSWVNYNMDSSKYDNVQFVTDMMFNWKECEDGSGNVCGRALGWGNIGTMCQGAGSTATNSVVPEYGGNDLGATTIAHELGHNFGLFHDGQEGPASSCGENDGLMGYGNNHEEFSRCSLDSMKQYNDYANGMMCLASGWSASDGVTTNYAGSDPVTPSPVTPTSPGYTAYPTPSPVSQSSDGDCAHIEVGFTNLDGNWNAYANFEYNGGKSYYFCVNGECAYLYRKELTAWGLAMSWIVADGWASNPVVHVFCTEDDLFDCGGKWKRWTSSSSYTVIAGSVTNAQCTASFNIDTSCASYDCLYVAGAESVDGYYDPTADCHDGHRVFSNSKGEYLCYSGDYNRWMFSDSQCSLGSVISAETSGDALSPDYWLISSGGSTGYTFSDSVYISDCSANDAFTGLECLENNEYEEAICLSSSSWGSDRTFSVHDELCANDRPVYHLTVYNESKAIVFGGATLSEGVEATLFLHFQPQYLFSTDNETTPQWMVTRDEISVNYLAKCSADDLMECTANRWTVRVTEFDDDAVSGIIEYILDDAMAVTNGACSAEGARADDGRSGVAAIVAVVVIALVALLCIVGFCGWRRSKQNEAMNHRQQIHGVPTGTGAEEAEPDQEAGAHVTTTHD